MRSRGHLDRSWIALVLAGSLVATGACSRAEDRHPHQTSGQTSDLDRALERLPARGAVGLLQTDTATQRGATGKTLSGRPATPLDRFGIASITKTFVATVVLQLVEQGRLSLDYSIEDVLPGALPYGRRITVRELLNHSSGLGDAGVPEIAPRKILEAIEDRPPLSRPGSVHMYANVNYVVLGVIVEEVTGRPLEHVVRDRILAPLGLDHTSYGSATTEAFEATPWLGDAGGLPAGGLVAAGGIVSTLDDVSTFFRALLKGELIGPDLLAEMTHTIKGGQGYRAGLGIFEEDLSCGTAWGHGGELPTYSSMTIASRDGSKVVVVAQNSGGWTTALDVAEEIYCS